MTKMIFGLDISDKSIEALQLGYSGGKASIAAYARVSLRGALVVNGVIKKSDQLSISIKELLKSAKPKAITSKECVLSLPESQVFTTVFSLPAGLKRQEILQTIPLKAEEVIPFKANDIYFDFRTIRVDASTQEVFYVAVPKKIIDSYVAMLADAGLTLVALDIESMSTARSTLAQLRGNAEPTLLIDCGARTTNLNVFDRDGIRDSRTLKLAGSHFTRAISKKLGIPMKDAEALKVRNGLDQSKQTAGAYEALQKEVAKFANETQKFITYYFREHHRRVGDVVLVGGSALVPGFDQALSKLLKLPVRRGDPLANLSDENKILKQKGKSVIFANVAGVALRGMSKNPGTSGINLLPITLKPTRKTGYWVAPVLILLLAVVAVAVAMYIRFGMIEAPMPPYQAPAPVAPVPDPSFVPTATTTAPTVSSPTSTPTSTQALSKVKIRPTTVGYVNVREQPTTASKIVGKANTGQEFTIVADQGGWVNIQFSPTVKGWISGAYVDKLQ